MLMLITACIKNEYQSPLFTKSDFPLTKGSYWNYEYQVFNANKITDTFQLRIVDVKQINTDTTEIFLALYNDSYRNDSAIGYLTNSGYTFKSTNTQYSYMGDYHINFPFKTGDSWESSSDTDIVKVRSYSEKYLDGNYTYNKVFSILGYFEHGLNINANEIIISKGIGVVYKAIHQENGDYNNDRKQSYKLINYHIQ
ncbi:MAG: hypothetical protein JNL95_05370 [Chitinophagales bacterium]|nr:hypothetical protein [Chitinophagales bacterium]